MILSLNLVITICIHLLLAASGPLIFFFKSLSLNNNLHENFGEVHGQICDIPC